MNGIKDAEEFFQQSAGKWRSQRTTHHLPFRRAETGGSDISVDFLLKDHPRIVEICKMHEFDPSLAIGGAFVSWEGAMAWDKEGEDHKGDTVFALIPDPENPRKGQLLRERGYAEIVPVAGHYEMDEDDGLILITEYETMSVTERFWFASPDLRLRTSTVQRFGGFNTATFCTELRVTEPSSQEKSEDNKEAIAAITGW
ncbi:phycobiliprotein lyase [Spirulina sp. 06S082]|uniref:phycobiliprotein lyase n=1 Tax=Spirulina sp. 06S082 TaxID=3110248 RepID=UPI002B21E7C9|nr:phycobiliprotein lyase [Spirulina sp. 06S082]MEA5471820.1 phycobiliprotein lyase [Spirulina sp. 06S082]